MQPVAADYVSWSNGLGGTGDSVEDAADYDPWSDGLGGTGDSVPLPPSLPPPMSAPMDAADVSWSNGLGGTGDRGGLSEGAQELRTGGNNKGAAADAGLGAPVNELRDTGGSAVCKQCGKCGQPCFESVLGKAALDVLIKFSRGRGPNQNTYKKDLERYVEDKQLQLKKCACPQLSCSWDWYIMTNDGTGDNKLRPINKGPLEAKRLRYEVKNKVYEHVTKREFSLPQPSVLIGEGPGAGDDGCRKRRRTDNGTNGEGNERAEKVGGGAAGFRSDPSLPPTELAPKPFDQELIDVLSNVPVGKYRQSSEDNLKQMEDLFKINLAAIQEALKLRAVVACKSYGVFFEVSERGLAHFILFIIEHDKNVQDRLSELGYRSFAPLDEGDGPMLICGYNIGDCETRPGRGISQGQRDLVKRLSAEYHARVPEPESIWIDSDSDGVTAGSGGAEAPAMDRLQQVESDGALARELQKEMDREEEDQRRRREEADALMAAQMQRDIEGGEPGQQGGSAAGAAFAGAVNPYATDPEKAAPVATLPYASAQASSRREKIERVVRDVLEGRYTAAQDPEGLLALVLPQKLVAKGAGAPRKTVKTRSPATSRGRGGAGSREGTGGLAEGRGGGGSVEGEETAKRREMLQELLCELHPLPAMPGREGGLLQVSVRAKKSEDDEDGVHLPVETSLVAQRPHVRTYTAEGGLLYVTRIRNLGDQSVTLTPEYYHISAATAPMGAGAAPEEQAREETITLQPGQESKEWGPLRLDVDDGERETGWKFEAEGEGEEEAILVLHVRLALG